MASNNQVSPAGAPWGGPGLFRPAQARCKKNKWQRKCFIASLRLLPHFTKWLKTDRKLRETRTETGWFKVLTDLNPLLYIWSRKNGRLLQNQFCPHDNLQQFYKIKPSDICLFILHYHYSNDSVLCWCHRSKASWQLIRFKSTFLFSGAAEWTQPEAEEVCGKAASSQGCSLQSSHQDQDWRCLF